MRKVVLAVTILVAIPPAARVAVNPPIFAEAPTPPGHYRLDKGHARVVADVRYMGVLHYALRFNRIDGSYDVDPARPGVLRLSVTVDARSFDDGGDAATRRIGDEILDADRCPRIAFNASAVQPAGSDHASVAGELTLRGVTKPVTLRVTWSRPRPGPDVDPSPAYSATAEIRRSDFGSRSWPAVIGDKVRLVVDARFIREG